MGWVPSVRPLLSRNDRYDRINHRIVLNRPRIALTLEPQNELNALRSAQASLAAAQGRLTEACNNFERALEAGFHDSRALR
jgi:hypothetical protein